MMRRRDFLTGATGLATSPMIPRRARAQSAARRLRFVPAADLASVDPLWSLAVISFVHGYMVWDTLFGVDLNLQPHPQMAERAEVSPDERTWTITLRDGLVFHDNEPVRATDCIASLKRWSEKDPFGQTIAGITAGMKALDDKRFQIELTRPFRQMLFGLASRNTFVMPERIARTHPASSSRKWSAAARTVSSRTCGRPAPTPATLNLRNTSRAAKGRNCSRAPRSRISIGWTGSSSPQPSSCEPAWEIGVQSQIFSAPGCLARHDLLVNARDAKHVPGRKTDVSDAQWLQRLHTYGLLWGSFQPKCQIAWLL
jgi:hypothetical protein